jgi:hypothetical protein
MVNWTLEADGVVCPVDDMKKINVFTFLRSEPEIWSVEEKTRRCKAEADAVRRTRITASLSPAVLVCIETIKQATRRGHVKFPVPHLAYMGR